MQALAAAALIGCGGGGGDAGDGAAQRPASDPTGEQRLAAKPAGDLNAIQWSAAVRLVLGPDDGIALRDLIHYRDPGGLNVRARFAEGMQTTASLDRRTLTFTIGEDVEAEPAFSAPQPLARPYSADALFRLTTLRGELLAYPYGWAGPVRQWSRELGRWADSTHPTFERARSRLIRNIQTVENRPLVFFEDGVWHGDQAIVLDAVGIDDIRILSIGDYAAGRITLSLIRGPDENLRAGLARCTWSPGDTAVRDCRFVEMPSQVSEGSNLDGLAYGWHHHRTGALLAYTLTGQMNALVDNRWQTVTGDLDGTHWQGYSSTELGTELLLGIYPQGNVARVDATTAGAPAYQVRLPEVALNNEPDVRRDEVQTVLAFGESVLAGVWPWGEVFDGTPARGWRRVARPFTVSGELPGPDHPYQSRVGDNCLGQRIFQIVPWSGGVAFNTTMKNMDAECQGHLALLAPAEQAEYGQVMYMARRNAVSCDLPWIRSEMDLFFVVTRDRRMQVLQNGHVLCEAAYSGRLPTGQPSPRVIVR